MILRRVISGSLPDAPLFYGAVIDPFMSPKEEAYAEALRRIREAEDTGAMSLDLSALLYLEQLPRELERLTLLQKLDLSWCKQLSDLSVLTGLTLLQDLNLSWCEQLIDVCELIELGGLQTLNLSGCGQLADLSALAGLKGLQNLDLSNCEQLVDVSMLAGLTSLRRLNLFWCRRLNNISGLASLTGLRLLNLSQCAQLHDISVLIGLTSLQWLDLRHCERLHDLDPLAGLTSLRTLDLSGCGQLCDLSPLAKLSSLETLDLTYCEQLCDLSPLAGLTSLQALDLSGCGRLCDLSPLAGLTSLQTLQLSHCKQLSDLSPLVALASLQALDLSGCGQLRDLPPLVGLSSLQTLELSYCKQLSDLSSLAGLASLQTLDLTGCGQLSGDLNPLGGLTSLQTLELSHCAQLRDLSPLATLPSLQTLKLTYCWYLGDLSPLAGLTSLQTLELSGCEQLRGDLSPLAGLTSLQTLELSGCEQLYGDLSPLAGLASLQTLDLSRCKLLRGDLSPLAGLTSLQTLKLSGCEQLNDLSPLATLASLQTLELSGCLGIRRLAPLGPLLSTLQELRLFGCQLEDLPSEVCGESNAENVLAKIRAHYEDLKPGQQPDAEVKVLFLGNGGTGKTQLCRRLRGEPFDPSAPSTHAIQVSEKTMGLEDFPDPVHLNLWDFGGQEIYHGSHALFVQGQAVFLILWTPRLEEGDDYEGDLRFRRHPLSYWLDYLRAFAEVGSPVLLIQSQCDTPGDRTPLPPVPMDDFTALQRVQVSAKVGLGLDLVTAALKEAVRDCFYRRPPPPIGVGRVKVRDRLRKVLAEDQALPPPQRRYRLLERTEFDRLCDEEGGISDKEALLDFLHHSGVIFYRPSLFGGRIVLDQNWALEAIYALFDRKKTFPLLRGYGRFTRADLEALIWSDYTPEEQKVFLGMMESCGICFRLRELSYDEWEYLAPELLPPWSDVQELLLGRLRDDPPTAEAEARYAFLHEGVLRGYLSKIGQRVKDAAVYWKYGCWFYEKTTKSQALIESRWADVASQSGKGAIWFRAWGERAGALIEPLLAELKKLPVGQAPQVAWRGGEAAHEPLRRAGVAEEKPKADLNDLEIPARPELPAQGQAEVYVSYAWGDNSSQNARRRTEVVDRLCQRLAQEGWNLLRDRDVMRPGELISGFMKRIGRADHVIVVLSDKYLHSTYCMTELYSIYQRSVGEKEDFLRRIIPLTLDDARFGTWRDRLRYTEYWETEFQAMEQHLKRLGALDFALYKAMQDWHNRVSDILAHVTDVLHPHGFEAIVKDDFVVLRQRLQQARSERCS
jgi:internalin A